MLDLAIIAVISALAFAAGGVLPVLGALVPTVCVAAWIGGWLFYVQHQYEDTAWEDGKD